jgi:hypothetical protein
VAMSYLAARIFTSPQASRVNFEHNIRMEVEPYVVREC